MEPMQYGTYLEMLGEELEQQNTIGEILLAENMLLLLDIFQQDISTDIELCFGSGKRLQAAAQHIAQREELPENWLTLAVKDGFLHQALSKGVIYRGLHMYVAPLGYLLTMFFLFGNEEANEAVRELACKGGLTTGEDVLQRVKAYLPKQAVSCHVQEKINYMFA